MRYIFFWLLCLSGTAFGQVNAGVRLDGYDASITGYFTRPTSSYTWGAGAWVEWRASAVLSVELNGGFAQRRGVLDLAPEVLAPEAVHIGVTTIGALARFRFGDGGSAGMISGIGGFVALPRDGDWKTDFGPTIELGLERGRVAVVAFGQVGMVDQVADPVNGSQRWVNLGLGVRGRIF